MAQYKDCLVKLTQVNDADIICYFSTFKKKSDITKTIELIIGCVKSGLLVPKSFKLNDNYRDNVENSQYRLTLKPDANDFFIDVKNTVNRALSASYKKTDVLKALVRLTFIYPEGDMQPLDNQILMNYITGNGSSAPTVLSSDFKGLSNKKTEKYSSETESNNNLEENKREDFILDIPESVPVNDEKEYIKAETYIRKADKVKTEHKEPENSFENQDEINLVFNSSGKPDEKESEEVKNKSDFLLNKFKRN